MTDRELLELAAKAAGFKDLTEWSDEISDYDSTHYGMPALHPKCLGGQCSAWNPLEDDGDALRLAVKLQMEVKVYANCVISEAPNGFGPCSESGDELCKLTRRAIVRAAAEIGRSMP